MSKNKIIGVGFASIPFFALLALAVASNTVGAFFTAIGIVGIFIGSIILSSYFLDKD